jgi:hypothetical protein
VRALAEGHLHERDVDASELVDDIGEVLVALARGFKELTHITGIIRKVDVKVK